MQRFSESTHIGVLNKACKMMKVRKKLKSFSSTAHTILPEVEDHKDEAVDSLLGEAGLVLELPAVLGAVQRGELEAVVGQNTREGVKEGPFKQKKVKVNIF